MNALIIIICVVTGTVGFNKTRRQVSPPYWRMDHFEERDLPDTLKGKSIQYIDSVFQEKRK
jgi:hypothetical protein